MKKINLAEAKDIYRNYLEKMKDDKLKEFVKIHSKLVGEMAIIISNGKFNNNFFRVAALLHDIGYSVDEANHAEHSYKILVEHGYDIPENLKDCILNHGNDSKPTTPEGKIFRLADKISTFDNSLIKIFIKHNSEKIEGEDLKFLEMMAFQGMKYLREIEF